MPADIWRDLTSFEACVAWRRIAPSANRADID
jgi:hypothetical protein